jgi:REP element-mobilizing transposase RayT
VSENHRRRLPHIYPENKLLFVTWHLHGSLPHHPYPPKDKLSAGQAFVWMDRYLDKTREGSLYLAQTAVAELVQESIYHGVRQLNHYDLHAYVIMANHVHLLVLPHVAPSRLLQTLKGYTARKANELLGRTGQPFWQAESYDRWVRDTAEAGRIRDYIENNPVKAGLAACPEDYRWSSAGDGRVERTLDSAGLAARATSAADF